MTTFYEIPDWPSYGISKDGQVRRIKAGVQGAVLGRVLKNQMHSKRGYLQVRLNQSPKSQTFDLHRLVALTFLGPTPEGMQICHNNGTKTDCRLENLRFDTVSANHMDKVVHGTSNRGTNQWKAKYTEEQVLHVKKLLNDGVKYKKISEITGVGYSSVKNIKYGNKWGWLKNEQ